MKNLRLSSWWLIAPAIVLLVVAFIIPLVEVGRWSLALEPYVVALGPGPYRGILLNTIELALAIAVGCTVIGYPAAYFLTQCTRRWQTILLLMILTPLWVSVLIRTYSWIVVLGREGMVNSLLIALGVIEAPARLLYTRFAVYMATMQVMLPIAILMMYGAMGSIRKSLAPAARILGASPGRAFFHVFLPLSMNGAISGAMLIFVLSLGFFITPALVGGPKDVLIANIIATQVSETLNWELASAMSIILLIASLMIVLALAFVSRRFTNMSGEGGTR